MHPWQTDAELFELMRRELYSPVVGDILDTLGRHHQFLPAAIRPLRADMKLAGRAEKVVRRDIESGLSATDAFARHGVL